METASSSKLLDIPREVIDLILELLLPPVVLTRGIGAIVPRGLYNLSTLASVCKFLYRMALPWMWKRAAILEKSQDSFYAQHTQWDYLCAHPEVAKHIRFLSFIRLESVTAFEYIHRLISFMDNLEVLQFVPDFFNEFSYEIYANLIHKPKLHTLIIKTLHFHDFALGNTGIEQLYIIAPFVRRKERQLKSGLAASHNVNSISWATLRHIVIEANEYWFELLDDFSSWRECNPDVTSPLMSISIGNYLRTDPINFEQLSEFITVFGGQNLTSLYLPSLEHIDNAIVSLIADAFPQLQRLMLHLCMWKSYLSLPEILEDIGFHLNLPQLKSLYLGPFDRKKLHKEIWSTVKLLANQCANLELVHASHSRNRSSAYFIERGYDGRFLKCERVNGFALHPPLAGWVGCYESG